MSLEGPATEIGLEVVAERRGGPGAPRRRITSPDRIRHGLRRDGWTEVGRGVQDRSFRYARR